jgi:hypothetical protein
MTGVRGCRRWLFNDDEKGGGFPCAQTCLHLSVAECSRHSADHNRKQGGALIAFSTADTKRCNASTWRMR